MATSSKRVPSLTASANYAQFGSWKTDLKAYLSCNDMQLWSSLDESKMPDAFPAAVAEDATGLAKEFALDGHILDTDHSRL